MKRLPIRWRLTALVVFVSAVGVAVTATVGLDRAEEALVRQRVADQEVLAREWLSYPVDETFSDETDLPLVEDFIELATNDPDSAAGRAVALAGWRPGDPFAYLADRDDAIVVDGGTASLLDPAELEMTPIHIEVLYESLFGSIGQRRGPDAGDVAFDVIDVDGTPLLIMARVDDIRGSLVGTRRSAVIWGPALVLIAGLAAWFLTRGALRPVGVLTNQVGRISPEETRRGVRVPVPPTRDELGALGTQLNDLLDRIAASDAVRRRFTADASHELRSPLAVLRSEAEQALDPTSSLDRFELADTVLAETRRMERLVDDLLVLARIDETGGAADPIVVDLDDIVLAEAARARRLAVGTSGVGAGRVVGDPEQLARAVRHLLDNAARHGVARVEIALHTVADTVTLTVDDDGTGVAPDDRERIFERFVRLDDARSRDKGGAGLGLAVTAACVRAGGGDLRVEDGPLGGARFVVTLPAAPGFATAPDRRPETDAAVVGR
ncbi:MAG: ATP-binding protein [Acidimicrobiales bacterium]